MRRNYKIFLNENFLEIVQDDPQKRQKAEEPLVLLDSTTDLESFLPTFMGGQVSARLTSMRGRPWLWRNIRRRFHCIDAAGGWVFNPSGEWLFIRRYGHWDLPKGKTQRMETLRSAALREVIEETGLEKLKVVKKAGITYHVYDHRGKWILKTTHWYLMESINTAPLVPQKEEGIEQVAWFSPKEALALLPETYASLRELIRESIIPSADDL